MMVSILRWEEGSIDFVVIEEISLGDGINICFTRLNMYPRMKALSLTPLELSHVSLSWTQSGQQFGKRKKDSSCPGPLVAVRTKAPQH